MLISQDDYTLKFLVFRIIFLFLCFFFSLSRTSTSPHQRIYFLALIGGAPIMVTVKTFTSPMNEPLPFQISCLRLSRESHLKYFQSHLYSLYDVCRPTMFCL